MLPTVCDSSCLIAFHRIGRVPVLEQVCAAILMPEAVARECAGIQFPSPSQIQRVQDQGRVVQLVTVERLGLGEAEAIVLADEVQVAQLVLDDRRARAVATMAGLPVTGTAGLLIHAKQRGIIPAVRPILDDLVATGFRISPVLYGRVLQLANE